MVQKWFPGIEQKETEETEKLTSDVRKFDGDRRQDGRIIGGRIMTSGAILDRKWLINNTGRK